MRYFIILLIFLTSCTGYIKNDGNQVEWSVPPNRENIYPHTLYSNPNFGEIIKINDSIIIVYNRESISKSESKIINIKNFKN